MADHIPLIVKMGILAALPLAVSAQALAVWGKSGALRRFWRSKSSNRDLHGARILLAAAVLLCALLPLVPYSAVLVVLAILILGAHVWLAAYRI